MKKKMLLVALVACLLAPATVFANDAFDISLGATAQYQEKPSDAVDSDFSDLSNYKFGADARVRIAILEVTGSAVMSSSDDGDYLFDTLLTAGVSFDVLKLVRVGVGIGPTFTTGYVDDEVTYYGANGETPDNFGDFLLSAPLTYRASADVMLGNIMAGISYSVPTDMSFNDFDASKMEPVWDNGKFGVSVLFNLI
ncbi:MAG: hypothetical protein LKE40_06115 [Spirochaetia bacterium]|nr:hypothetical protein [Spirochaetia bacterium]